MKRITVLLVLGWTTSALAYTPTNWLPEHAASDFQKSDAIVVGRVVGLNRSAITNPPNGRVAYYATFSVGRTLRGPLRPSDEFTFLIGEEWVGNPPDDDRPSFGLLIFGTHSGYWLEFNGVYLLCLRQTERGWEPRSGTKSVFRVHRQHTGNEPTPLVVNPRGNHEEGHRHVIRAIKENPQVLLNDFLRERLGAEVPNQASEDIDAGASNPQR